MKIKHILFILGFALFANINYAQCPLERLVSEINVNPQLKNAIKDQPDLIDAWKKLDDLGADDALKNNPDALKYVTNGRRNQIMLEVEEAFGGHSIARHGSQIPMDDLRLRVIGEHPSFPQSRSALKFDNDVIHQDAVNRAFAEHKEAIEAHFSSGGLYKEWDFTLSDRIGEGYHNIGSRNNPVSQYVTSNKIKITFDADPNSPSGYVMISAYPWYQP